MRYDYKDVKSPKKSIKKTAKRLLKNINRKVDSLFFDIQDGYRPR